MSVSKALLYRKGSAMTVKQTAYTADPDGGGTIRDAANDTSVSVQGMLGGFAQGQIDNVNVQRDDVMVYLDGTDLSGSAWTCARGDRITVGSRELRVLDPSPVVPDDGNPVLYAAHCGNRAGL